VKYALGFDLSLTAPAAVALPLNWRPGDWKRAKSWLMKPKAPKNDDTAGQMARYGDIMRWAADVFEEETPSEYAIEAYAFSKNNAQASRLMELGGIVRFRLYAAWGAIPIVIAASSARKTIFGKNPISDPKLRVQVALDRAGAPKAWEENICDAFVIANHLLSVMGGKSIFLGDTATMRYLDRKFPPPERKPSKSRGVPDSVLRVTLAAARGSKKKGRR
jgi:Holliday junction resolvasome RuvABC endonuclease subunit